MINCVLIGEGAGADLSDDSDGIIIIGDGVKNLDRTQKNVLFLGDKCAIGIELFGRPFNLKELIDDCLE